MKGPILPLSARSPLLLVLLGALAAIPPLSIDMGLPALGRIAAGLHATPQQAGLTLSLFLLGFAVAPLVMGPLADRFGRRPVLLAGVATFLGTGIACAAAPSIALLLTARLIQGVGAGAAATLPMAVVRDLFSGAEGRRSMSYMALVTGIAPIVAPTLGSIVLAVADWRSIYGLLAAIGGLLLVATWFGLPESAPDGGHHSLHPARIAATYGHLLRNRVFLGYGLLNAFGFGSMFAYISGSPLVFMHGFGMSMLEFSLIFATTAAAIMVGSIVNGRAAAKGIAAETMLRVGLALLVMPAIMLFLLSLAGLDRLFILVPLIAMTVFSQGVIMPNATHGALQPVGAIAGTASAGLRALQMLFGAVSSSFVTATFDGHSARSMTMMMALCGIGALMMAVFVLRLGQETGNVEQAHGRPVVKPPSA